jgi:UDP-glucose 4-epimerase
LSQLSHETLSDSKFAMKILVAGGAGYIGSHMIRRLDRAGCEIVVLDNLSTGHRESVKGFELVVGDIADTKLVTQVLGDHKIDAVMHFAANALVGESMEQPAKYYHNNVVATLSLLESMLQSGVKQIVFSSSCAVYGVPGSVPITEKEIPNPVNPYGFTKFVIERALADYASAYGLGFAALRYFNAAGAALEGSIGEDHLVETHLIPLVLQCALGQRERITVFGDDWDTLDGTCVRDYIHVEDLATAHLAALERIKMGQGLLVNLGTGQGYSVRQIVETCREITGREIKEVVGSRRPGDPPVLVADPRLAKQVLGWSPVFTEIREIIASAWKWHLSHPQGYATQPQQVG